jgi:hypothetical protein
MRTTATATPKFRQLLVRNLIVVAALLTLPTTYVAATATGEHYSPSHATKGTTADVEIMRPPAPGSVNAAQAGRVCWSDAAPQGHFAGAVVLRHHDGTAVLRTDRPTLDRAINQAVFGKGTGLDVVAFCDRHTSR